MLAFAHFGMSIITPAYIPFLSLFSGLKSPLGPILGTSIVTLLYSALGGLPVSLFTDRIQVCCALLPPHSAASPPQ